MLRYRSWYFLVAFPFVFGALAPVGLRADEWEESSPFYEDDAWYDISEWLDGNDYNPVDEQYGRWDDEVYDSDAPSRDNDNDRARTYGYNSPNADDWFYDYWYPHYTYYGTTGNTSAGTSTSGLTYDRTVYYRDLDGDGRYDSYVGYYDYDNDGDYDRVVSYDFRTNKADKSGSETAGSSGSESKTASSQKDKEKGAKAGGQAAMPSGKRHQIIGKIVNQKTIDVRGTKHSVIQLQHNGDQKVAVDLGRTSKLGGVKLEKDAQVTVEGPMTQAGDKKVIVAQSFKLNGQQHSVDRSARKFTGKVVDIRETTIRGQKHKLVMLKLDSGKQRLVDLGPSARLKKVEIQKDTSLTLRGVPFAIQDRPLILAQSIEKDGQQVMIDRRPAQKAGAS